jgi:hypothetical protein
MSSTYEYQTLVFLVLEITAPLPRLLYDSRCCDYAFCLADFFEIKRNSAMKLGRDNRLLKRA